MSDKPISERLQVKGHRRLAVVGAAPLLEAAIGLDTPRAGLGEAEVVLGFAADRTVLAARLVELLQGAHTTAILWVAYPKLTSSLAVDLSREVVREDADRLGLETVSQIAIDADWSAMRLKRVD